MIPYFSLTTDKKNEQKQQFLSLLCHKIVQIACSQQYIQHFGMVNIYLDVWVV